MSSIPLFPQYLKYGSYGAIPIGGIILWSGSTSIIPTNWALCDGNNGTPNLTDRFVIGAGGSYNVGVTGGEATVTLTISEIPAHAHGFAYQKHQASDTGQSQADCWKAQTSGFTTNTSQTGGGNSHNNMPPYYALAYIMRIS